MKFVAPFGFYGWGNIGDEATLQGFARLMSRFNPNARVWVASRNPRHTARVEPHFRYYKMEGWDPRRRWARLGSEGVMVAGGTPIMDILGRWPLQELVPIMEAMHRRGKPISFVGIGTERLQRDDSKKEVGDKLARLVRHWTVRCRRDEERLKEYGVSAANVTVAADMAWLLDPVPTEFGKKYLSRLGLNGERLIGMNVMDEPYIQESDPRIFSKLAEFLDTLVVREDARVLFLANEVRAEGWCDTAAGERIAGAMKHRDRVVFVPNHYWTPGQMMSFIGCCSLTISMRYHFCLFSALQGVPFIAIERSEKVSDLRWDLNWPFGVELNGCSEQRLLAMVEEIEQGRSALTERLRIAAETMHERAERNAASLRAMA